MFTTYAPWLDDYRAVIETHLDQERGVAWHRPHPEHRVPVGVITLLEALQTLAESKTGQALAMANLIAADTRAAGHIDYVTKLVSITLTDIEQGRLSRAISTVCRDALMKGFFGSGLDRNY